MAAENETETPKKKRKLSLMQRILKQVTPRRRKATGDDEENTGPEITTRICKENSECRVRLGGMARGETRIHRRGRERWATVRTS